jgi:DNA recombination protein RmuC
MTVDPMMVLAAGLGLLVLALGALLLARRPSGEGGAEAGAMLARLELLAEGQRHQGEGQLRQEQALADRLAEATRHMTDTLVAQSRAVNEALTAQNDRLARQEKSLAETLAAQNQRLDAVLVGQTDRVTKSLADQALEAQKTAAAIQERLAVIDAARGNIEALGSQVGSLAAILSNKQARGAFGEVQLRQLVEDRLPADGFAWQHSFSNRTRCDCLIRLPFPPGPIVVDSKFPLEAWLAARDAADDAARGVAAKQFAGDMRKHIQDIAQKYIIAGETAEGALMFVPSEAVYADLHAAHDPLVQEAARRGVYIVSPSTLWAVLGTMRALLLDVRMRGEASRIKDEVRKLVEELGRLEKRSGNLAKHFIQMQEDVREIETTTDKIARAGRRIEAVELPDLPALPAPAPRLAAPEAAAGQAAE